MKRQTKIILSPKEIEAIIDFLKGNCSSRDLGTKLGLSHQGALNLAGSMCRQWIQDGSIIFWKNLLN